MASRSSDSFTASPAAIKQGNALRVAGPANVESVRVGSHTYPLYPDGLIPIPVLTPPGTYLVHWLEHSGVDVHSQKVVVLNAHYPIQNIVLSKALTNLHSTPAERDDVGAFLKESSKDREWQEPFVAPLSGCITSPFGVRRWHNGKPTSEYHAGLDQRGAAGTPIHAITAGEVKLAQQFTLRGGTVAIDHGQGVQSIYLHMSKIAAHPGQHVSAGDTIGYVGSTGRSTGPHLHWTIYVFGEPVNPLQWVHLQNCAAEKK